MSGDTDLQAKLSQILSDPQAMQQVMSVAGALMGGGAGASAGAGASTSTENLPHTDQKDAPQESAETESPPKEPAKSAPDLAGLLNALSAKPSNDPRCTLLSALKPFLGDARRERADALIRAIRLAEIAGNFIK